MKVYLVLEYNSKNQCRVLDCYLNILAARTRVDREEDKNTARTYHIIRKTLKGQYYNYNSENIIYHVSKI